jgi:hypothetical protein
VPLPFPIQRTPRGLLELLSVFGGDAPRLLDEEVSGIVDLRDFYGADRMINTQTVGAAGAYPRTVSTTPVGTTIRVHNFGAQLNNVAAGAANAYYIGLVRLQDPNQIQVPVFSAVYQAPAAGYAAGTLLDFGGQLPYPRVIPPGWVLTTTVFSNDPAAGAILTQRFSFENLVA